ncbi:MAG: AmmeMemoRadiSam system protein A [Pseudomonadota bacterium]
MPASDWIEFDSARQTVLLQLARTSITHGLQFQQPAPLPAPADEVLQQPRASFVTLYRETALRGCIGSLWPRRSLLVDVNENAFAAAFRDPRFTAVGAEELHLLQIELTVLSAIQPLSAVTDEAALLAQLRPGIDGVIIEQAGRRSTYLPKVWQHFADAEQFLQSLRQKAGLPGQFDAAAHYSVYQAQSFAQPWLSS